jgi:hypothetical protein
MVSHTKQSFLLKEKKEFCLRRRGSVKENNNDEMIGRKRLDETLDLLLMC